MLHDIVTGRNHWKQQFTCHSTSMMRAHFLLEYIILPGLIKVRLVLLCITQNLTDSLCPKCMQHKIYVKCIRWQILTGDACHWSRDAHMMKLALLWRSFSVCQESLWVFFCLSKNSGSLDKSLISFIWVSETQKKGDRNYSTYGHDNITC